MTACAGCKATAATELFTIDISGFPSNALLRCDHCNLIRLRQRPTDTDLGSYYRESYYAFTGRSRSVLKQLFWNMLRDYSSGIRTLPRPARGLKHVFQRLADRAFDINVPLSGSLPNVLDFGCGFGDLLIYLRSRGCAVLGIDFDSRAADIAAKYDVPVYVGPLGSAPIENATFDTVVLCHSLEHVPRPDEVLPRLAAALRLGGEMRIAVPNGAAAALYRQKDQWFHLSYPLHFWFFDAPTLSSLLDSSGMDVVEIGYGMTWRTHFRQWYQGIRGGQRSVVAEAIGLIAEVLRNPARRDVLRVTAQRVR